MNEKIIEGVGMLSLQSFIQGMDTGEEITESLLLESFEKMGITKSNSEEIIYKMKNVIRDRKRSEADKFSDDIVSALRDVIKSKGATNE